MFCTFSSVVQNIIKYTGSSVTNKELINNIFYSFYAENPYFTFDDATVSRWINGEYKIPKEIANYYGGEQPKKSLSADFEKHVLPNITDISALADSLYSLAINDMNISEQKRTELTEGFSYSDNTAVSAFAGGLIYFGITRKPLTDNQKNLPAEKLSPSILDIVIGNDVPAPCKYFCGRDTELDEINTLLSENNKIFISGIAGIGKSELAKAYAKKYKKEYTNILYFYYSGSLKNMITDMDFTSDLITETEDMRFKKHNRFLRSLKADTLIIIDNFNVPEHKDPALEIVMKYNCKIIFTSRCSYESSYTYNLKEIENADILAKLFGKFYPETEIHKDTVMKIIETVHHHTMAVELSARLMKKGILSPDEILEKLSESSAAPNSNDKIGMKKDGANTNATYYNHIKTLFSLYRLDEENTYIMRCAAFISDEGIKIKMFAEWAGLADLNGINDLIETGLIQNNCDDIITLHPLIRDISAADLQPDFNNCKAFIDKVHEICLAVGIKIIYHKTVLAAAENIMRYAIKNDISEYLLFIEDAFNFMETYRCESGMSLAVAEITTILKNAENGTDNDRALMYNFKASYENLFTENITKAIGYAGRALKTCDENSNPVLAANLNMNLGNLYVQKKELDKARIYMETAIKLMSLANTPTADFIIMSRNYADLLFMQGEKLRALNALVKCADFAKSINHIEYPALLFDEAVISIDLGNITEAVQLFELSFKAYAKIGSYEELQKSQLQAAAMLSKYGVKVGYSHDTELT